MSKHIFDFLTATCPKCHNRLEAEVKGECCFVEYNLDRPVCISDAQKLVGNVVTCDHCKTRFVIQGDLPTYKVHLLLDEIKG